MLSFLENPGVLSGYLNAELVFSDTYANDLNNTEILYLGTDRDINKYWNGSIDELKVFRGALSIGQIRSEYQNYNEPDFFTAIPGLEEVTLRWSSERINYLSSYQIYKEGSLLESVDISSPNDTVYFDLGLTANDTLSYFLTSTDSLGNVSQPTDTLTVVVLDNQPPLANSRFLNDLKLVEGFDSLMVVDLDDVFTDNENDSLTFSANSSNTGLVDVVVDDSTNILTIFTPSSGLGISTITVNALDSANTTSVDFDVDVVELIDQKSNKPNCPLRNRS